ncbi:MAG: TetR/AcrR family transcriptional regulator [Microlunatus sp.]|nr:TetR/AcrR family transcriptional regulator [Microlunatus sp.]
MDEHRRTRGRPRTGVRESVIAAAAELLAEVGVVGFTTKAVAVRAGVAESSVFYHFGDRAGLLREIIFAEVGGYKAVVKELIDADVPPEAGIKRLLDFLEDYYQRILPGMIAVLADPQLQAGLRDHRHGADAGPHRAVEPVQDYLAGQRAAGRIADVDLAALALAIVGSAFQRALAARFGAARSLPSTARVAAELLRPAAE